MLGSCGYDKTTIEDPFGRKIGVTSEELAFLNELTSQGLPGDGPILDLLRLGKSYCAGNTENWNAASKVLVDVLDFTGDDLKTVHTAADKHLC